MQQSTWIDGLLRDSAALSLRIIVRTTGSGGAQVPFQSSHAFQETPVCGQPAPANDSHDCSNSAKRLYHRCDRLRLAAIPPLTPGQETQRACYAANTGTVKPCCHMSIETLNTGTISRLLNRRLRYLWFLFKRLALQILAITIASTMRFSSSLVTTLLAVSAYAVSSDSTIIQRQSSSESDYKIGFTPLKTNWTDKVGTNPWPEYPRPRLQRSNWKNLNGVWRYRNATSASKDSPPFGERLENPVLVPFCLESALSGKYAFEYDRQIG